MDIVSGYWQVSCLNIGHCIIYTGMSHMILYFVDKLKKEVQEPSFRDWVLYDSHPKWKYDPSKKVKDAEPQASFRKLNID